MDGCAEPGPGRYHGLEGLTEIRATPKGAGSVVSFGADDVDCEWGSCVEVPALVGLDTVKGRTFVAPQQEVDRGGNRAGTVEP